MQAMAKHDRATAASAMTALQSDRISLDQAMKAHPSSQAAEKWKALEKEFEMVTGEVSKTAASGEATAAGVEGAPMGVPPVGVATAPSTPVSTTASAANEGGAPQIVVSSRERTADGLRIRGYFEGTALKSAGIYNGPERVRAFKVNDVVGAQRVRFDLGLADPTSDTVLRVTDADDRVAEVPVIESSSPIAPPFAPRPSTEAHAATEPTNSPTMNAGDGSNAAEIPSH